MDERNNNTKGTNGRNNHRSNKRNRSANKKNKEFRSKEARYDAEANKGQTKASNDIAWYGIDSVLMKDAASLPFSNTAGMPYNLGNEYCGTSPTSWTNPGIMELNFIPLPGTLNDWSAPANVAIRDMYTFVRKANSGAANYDAANLGMYLMAYDSCAIFYAWMCRIYGLARTVIARNRYAPETLFKAMGVDYSNIIRNLAQLRAYINTFPARFYHMKVPSRFHLIERHMWMVSHVFADAPSEKAQFYIFNPSAFWQYVLAEDKENSGMFMDNAFNDGLWDRDLTYERIEAFGEELLNSVLINQEFANMSGDIERAYGSDVFSLNMIGEDYSVVPVYDPEVLLQIHNATVLMNSDDGSSADYTQWRVVENSIEGSPNLGALELIARFNTQDYAGNAYSMLSKILDMPMDKPEPGHVAVATRLMCQTAYNKENENYLELQSYGTEVITDVFVWTREVDGSCTYETFYKDDPDIEIFSSHPYRVVAAIQQPQQDPDLGFYGNVTVSGIDGDFDNYTVISPNTLFNIHRAALMGMYGLTT